MNLFKLTLRSLAHYWRANLAVMAGAATAVAVLVGSLLVGDSVQGSLRELALRRLGNVEYALVADRFFRADLAGEVAAANGFQQEFRSSVGAILLQGTARTPTGDRTAPRANMLGVGEDFWRLAGGGPTRQLRGRDAAVSAGLAETLELEVGDALLVSVGREGPAPGDTVFAYQSRTRTIRTLRVTVRGVLPQAGAGRFSLRGDRPDPHNIYVALEWLQQQLEQPGRANAILVGSPQQGRTGGGDETLLARALAENATLEDYGLRLSTPEPKGYLSVRSRRMVLDSRTVQGALVAAERLGARAGKASVYLANTLSTPEDDEGGVPYSVVAVLDEGALDAAGGLALTDGTPAPVPAQGEILLNSWSAQDLDARGGDTIRMTYYARAENGRLHTYEKTFAMVGIVAMQGAAADPDVVPEFEGLTDAETMQEWDPPFPMDTSRIRPKDEQYWDERRATPKAFLAPETVKRIWQSARVGDEWVTSVLVKLPPQGRGGFTERYRAALLDGRSPEEYGLVFRPVREQALAAARGSTDFGVLFLSMSMFLLAAAAMLLGLMLRLNVERRAGQQGIMHAVGLPKRLAAGPLAVEAGLVALCGALVGVPAGVGYARLIILGLHTWWEPAAGEMPFELHVTASGLAIGLLSGLIVAALAIWWGIRLLRKAPALQLLAGWQAVAREPRSAARRRSAWIGVAATVGACVLLVLSGVLELVSATGAFFGIGTLLLVGALAFVAASLQPASAGHRSAPGLAVLAWRGASRNRVRSLLTAGLLAAASFMIVAVAVNRRDMSQVDVRDPRSGAGGFSLVARTNLGVHADLSTESGRQQVGLTPAESEALARATIVQLRMSQGDDISCLNVHRPSAPRVLGVPDRLIERGGFRFAEHLPQKGAARSPWELLRRDEPGQTTLPAFADAASAKWILHKGLADTLAAPAGAGPEVQLKLVGLLANTIFQSETMVAEEPFVRHFGAASGYRYFLVETPRGETEAVAAALRSGLAHLGVEVLETRQLLARFAGVQNTYLATFQTLGGLGLLLGTLGLVTVLLRGVVERRGEFALMLAVGIPRRQITAAIVLENVILLGLGIAIGSVTALVAVYPHLASTVADVRWVPLAGVLAACLAAGVGACVVAAAASVRSGLLSALRAE